MGRIADKAKSLMPKRLRKLFQQKWNHWRRWRYGSRGTPAKLCGESFRFKFGYEPAPDIPGKFWEEDRLFMKVFYETIEEGQTVVDVGAFVGHYTMLAARKVGPNGRVISFEPSPASWRILINNLVLNDLLDRVDVWPMAAGRSDGFAQIYFQTHDPVRGHNSMSCLPFEQRGLTESLISQPVPCVALGPFLDSLGLRPDVIKIDIEGPEIEVLQSLVFILQTPALIFCELHPQLWIEPERQFNNLQLLLDRTGRIAETLGGQPLFVLQHEPVILRKK